MKNESLQNYDNSLFAKIVRKIVSFGEKMPRLSVVILKEESVAKEIIPVVKEFLESLDNAIENMKFKDKSLFLAIQRDLEEGNIVIDFKNADEEEFFELNPYVDFYMHKGEKYICINKDNMYEGEEISKYKILHIVGKAFICYIVDKTIYNKEFGFKYKWVNLAINEMLVSYILNKECEKNLREIKILKRFLEYNKKYNEIKLFQSYLEGDLTYLYKLISEETLYNLEILLKGETLFDIKELKKSKKANDERIDKLYVNHILSQNSKKLKEDKIEYEKLYEKYFNIAKENSNSLEYVNKVVLERILEDVKDYVISKEKKAKDAVKRFLEYINEDQIYRIDFNNIEGKNLILKQILKIRSYYGEDVSLEYMEVFNAYIDARNSLNKSSLDIEEETGRCIINMYKDVKRIYKPMEIKNGKELYTIDYINSYKVGKKSTQKITFIYDGTIKDEKSYQKKCETKFNLKLDNEKLKFEKMFFNKLIQYKEFIKNIKEEQDKKIEIYNDIFNTYISKYYTKRQNNFENIGNKKQNKYVLEKNKKDNTLIIQEIKKMPEKEFLDDIENNTKKILTEFSRLNEMYNEV